MNSHILEFLNHLYHRPPNAPIFFDDLIRSSLKKNRTNTPPAPPVNELAHLHTPSGYDIAIKKIKASVIVNRDKIMKLAEGVIPAPIGVEIDSKTGQLKVPIEIIPVGDVVLKPKIVDDLLINEGFIKLKIIVYSSDSEPCTDARKCLTKEATIPIHSIHQIDGISPGDNVQEKVSIKSISLLGFPDHSLSKAVGKKINLTIKVVLEVKLTISREEIISVLVCK